MRALEPVYEYSVVCVVHECSALLSHWTVVTCDKLLILGISEDCSCSAYLVPVDATFTIAKANKRGSIAALVAMV